MRIDEIEVGQVLWTRVSGGKVKVRVVAVVERQSWGETRKMLRKVLLESVDSGRPLPKPRSASALHRTRDFTT